MRTQTGFSGDLKSMERHGSTYANRACLCDELVNSIRKDLVLTVFVVEHLGFSVQCGGSGGV